MSLADLAPELVDQVISHFELSILCIARLVNRAWHRTATKHLFHAVALTPTSSGLKSWNLITDSDSLRHTPSRATINTCPAHDYEAWNTLGTVTEYQLISEWDPDS